MPLGTCHRYEVSYIDRTSCFQANAALSFKIMINQVQCHANLRSHPTARINAMPQVSHGLGIIAGNDHGDCCHQVWAPVGVRKQAANVGIRIGGLAATISHQFHSFWCVGGTEIQKSKITVCGLKDGVEYAE